MLATSPTLSTGGGVFQFDEFELDSPAFELRRSGVPVPMEPQVFEVLAFLVQNAGRVVTKDEILDRVWPERYVSEASLNSRVMSARKALGDSGSEQRYIKTVHGRGYRFAAAVTSPTRPAESSSAPHSNDAAPAGAASTGFVGREEELARIDALLAQPACRLITIVGPGGIGKTRLAARAVEGRTPAATFVSLEHVEPAMFVPALAAALSMHAAAGDPLEQVIRYLGAHEKLVVLDNVEHLADALGPALEAILSRTAGTRFILTSRATLGMRQEWVLRLGGLDTRDAAELFSQRLRQANVQATAGNSADAAEICRLVDGLPLAIELAASLGRYLPTERIRELVEEDAAAALRTSLQDRPERHRGVESLFVSSLGRLAEPHQAALAALAVFEVPFEEAAARAVAGTSLPTLYTLVEASLLSPRDGRFAMHPLLRQHLSAKRGADVEAAREAHALHFAEFVACRTPALQGNGQLEAVRAIDSELPNVFAAWRWAVSRGRFDVVEQLRRGFATYLVFGCRFLEGATLFSAALAALEQRNPELRSSLLVHHGWILLRLGRVREATAAFVESMQISEGLELEWKHGYGSDARIAVAALELGAGNYPAAFEAGGRSLALAEAAGDAAGAAFAAWLAAAARLRQAKVVWEQVGDRFRSRPAPGDTSLDEAAALTARALQLLDGTDEAWLLGYVNIELGIQASMAGDPERACSHFRRAYQLRRSLDDPQGMASALIYLSDTLVGLGEPRAAHELHPHIRELLLRSGDAQGRAEVLRAEGLVGIALGDLDLARRRLCEAITVSQSLDFVNNVVGALRGLGEVFGLEGRTELSGRIMAAVAEHPATTPSSRAHAARVLAEMDAAARFAAQTAAGDFDSLVEEAVRVATPMGEWLRETA